MVAPLRTDGQAGAGLDEFFLGEASTPPPTPPPIPSRHKPIADGWHHDCRWWLTRIEGDASSWATVSGWIEGGCLFDQVEMPDATAATVSAWIDDLLAKRRSRRK
jgi:hypothetical protein